MKLDFVKTFIESGIVLPPNVQNMLGEELAKRFQAAHAGYVAKNPNAPAENFWQTTEGPYARDIRTLRQEVAGQPVDFSYLSGSIDASLSARERDRLQQGIQTVRGATTVGELQNVLFQSIHSGIGGFLSKQISKSKLTEDEIFNRFSNLSSGVLEAMPYYQRFGPSAQDPTKTEERTFVSYVLRGGRDYNTAFRRAEHQAGAPLGLEPLNEAYESVDDPTFRMPGANDLFGADTAPSFSIDEQNNIHFSNLYSPTGRALKGNSLVAMVSQTPLQGYSPVMVPAADRPVFERIMGRYATGKFPANDPSELTANILHEALSTYPSQAPPNMIPYKGGMDVQENEMMGYLDAANRITGLVPTPFYGKPGERPPEGPAISPASPAKELSPRRYGDPVQYQGQAQYQAKVPYNADQGYFMHVRSYLGFRGWLPPVDNTAIPERVMGRAISKYRDEQFSKYGNADVLDPTKVSDAEIQQQLEERFKRPGTLGIISRAPEVSRPGLVERPLTNYQVDSSPPPRLFEPEPSFLGEPQELTPYQLGGKIFTAPGKGRQQLSLTGPQMLLLGGLVTGDERERYLQDYPQLRPLAERMDYIAGLDPKSPEAVRAKPVMAALKKFSGDTIRNLVQSERLVDETGSAIEEFDALEAERTYPLGYDPALSEGPDILETKPQPLPRPREIRRAMEKVDGQYIFYDVVEEGRIRHLRPGKGNKVRNVGMTVPGTELGSEASDLNYQPVKETEFAEVVGEDGKIQKVEQSKVVGYKLNTFDDDYAGKGRQVMLLKPGADGTLVPGPYENATRPPAADYDPSLTKKGSRAYARRIGREIGKAFTVTVDDTRYTGQFIGGMVAQGNSKQWLSSLRKDKTADDVNRKMDKFGRDVTRPPSGGGQSGGGPPGDEPPMNLWEQEDPEFDPFAGSNYDSGESAPVQPEPAQSAPVQPARGSGMKNRLGAKQLLFSRPVEPGMGHSTYPPNQRPRRGATPVAAQTAAPASAAITPAPETAPAAPPSVASAATPPLSPAANQQVSTPKARVELGEGNINAELGAGRNYNPDPEELEAAFGAAPPNRTRLSLSRTPATRQPSLQPRNTQQGSSRRQVDQFTGEVTGDDDYSGLNYTEAVKSIGEIPSQAALSAKTGKYGAIRGTAGGGIEYAMDGQTIIPEEQVSQGVNIGAGAWANVRLQSGRLKGNPTEVAATVRGMLHDYIAEEIDNYGEQLKKEGRSPADVRTLKDKVQTVAEEAVKPAMGELASKIGDGDFYAYAKSKHFRIHSLADRDAAIARDPKLAANLANLFPGDTLQNQLASRTPAVVSGDEGRMYQVGGGDPGGGGSGDGGGPRGPQRMFSGGMGRFLYGAYIARRFWSWTAGPMFQDMEQVMKAQAGWAPHAMAAEGSPNLHASSYGYYARQEASKKYWAEGTRQQFGAFSELGYALTGGGDAPARMMATTKMGLAGVGAGWAAMTAAGALAGVGGTGAAVGAAAMSAAGPAAMIAGGGLILGGLVMEGVNYAQRDNPNWEPWTYGGAATATQKQMLRWKAGIAKVQAEGMMPKMPGAIFNPAQTTLGMPVMGGAPFNPAQATLGMLVGGRTPQEDLLQYLNDAEVNTLLNEGPSEEFKAITAIAKANKEKSGTDDTELQGVYRPLITALPGGIIPNKALLDRLSDIAKSTGQAEKDFMTDIFAAASQRGISPGTGRFADLFRERTGEMTEAERQTIKMEDSAVARYGGMLAGYYHDPRRAMQFTSRMGIRTQGQAQAYQALMASANMFGFDAESIVGWGTTPEMQRATPMTMEQLAAQAVQGRLPFQSMMDAQLATTLQGLGVNLTTAMHAGGNYNIQTEPQLQAAQSFLGVAQQFYSPSEVGQYSGALIESALSVNPFQAGQIAQMAPRLMAAGYGMDVMTSLAGSGLSNQQMSVLGMAVGGDLRAASFMAWQSGDPTNRMYDQAGRPVWQSTPGGNFRQTMNAQAGLGSWGAQRATTRWGATAGMGNAQWAMQAYGMNARMAQTFTSEEGYRGLQGFSAVALEQSDIMFGFQMAGIGVQARGIQQQRRHLWGSGTWDSPAPGSMWYLEDRMRAQSHAQQLYGFEYSGMRLEVGNQFGMRQEALNLQRMQVGHQYQIDQEDLGGTRMSLGHAQQRWQFGFDLTGMQMQRQWGREDWQYQDQMRGLQFGWNIEDINEGIRHSSGRERAKLVKQRDRAVLTNNLESGQIETQRERQEEVWGREEERFNKQIEQAENLMRLDVQGFDLQQNNRRNLQAMDIAGFNLQKEQREAYYKMDQDHLARQISDYHTSKEIQDEIQDKQRQFQAQQLELQEQSLGVQAGAARAAKEFADAQTLIQDDWEKMSGTWEQMARYDPEKYFQSLLSVVVRIDQADSTKMTAVREAVTSLSSVDTAKATAMKEMYNEMKFVPLTTIREMKEFMAAWRNSR